MKKKLLPAVLAAVILLCFNRVQAQQKNAAGNSGIPNVISISSVNAAETSIEYVENGHKHKASLNNSKIVNLYVDGKKIPASGYAPYEPMIKKIVKQLEVDRNTAGQSPVPPKVAGLVATGVQLNNKGERHRTEK